MGGRTKKNNSCCRYRASVYPTGSLLLHGSIKYEPLFEMVHILETAEGRRFQFYNRCGPAQRVQRSIEHRLPCSQCRLVEPASRVAEGDMEDVAVMVGMPVAEDIGKSVTPSVHRPSV